MLPESALRNHPTYSMRGVSRELHACTDSALCGGSQIDDNMMGELKDVKAAVKPTDTLLVVDAMTGQEAAGLVKAFHEAADLSGV